MADRLTVAIRYNIEEGGLVLSLGRTKTALKQTGDEGKKAGQDIATGAAKGEASLKKLGNTASEVKGKLGELRSTLNGVSLALGGGLATAAAVGTMALRGGLQVFGEYEQGFTRLKVLLKDSGLAQRVTGELAQRSARNPFELPEMINLFAQLQGSGIAPGEIMNNSGRDLLTVLGDVKATNPTVSLEQVARAYLQTRMGSFQLPEMMAIGVSRGALEQKGVKFDSTGQMKTSGEAAANALVEVFIERFKGGMEEQSKLLPGLLSTFMDNAKGVIRNALEPVNTEVKGFLGSINAELSKLGKDAQFMASLREGAQEIANFIKAGGQQVITWLREAVQYLKENPTALVDGLRAAAEVSKTLLVVLGTLIGIQGLLGLAEGVLAVVALFSGPGGWVIAIGLVVAALVGSAGLQAALDAVKKDGIGGLSGALDELNKNPLVTLIKNVAELVVSLAKLGEKLQPVMKVLNTPGEIALNTGLAALTGTINLLNAALAKLNFLMGATSWDDFNSRMGSLVGGYGYGTESTQVTGATAGGVQYKFENGRFVPVAAPAPSSAGPQEIGPHRPPGPYRDTAAPTDIFGMPGGSGGVAEGEVDRRSPEQRAWDAQYNAAVKATKDKINAQPGGKGPICVVKTGDTLLAFGGDQAKKIHDSLFNTKSTGTLIENFQKAKAPRLGLKDLQPGDFIMLDRKDGVNGEGDGHTGFFMGLTDDGQIIMSGNGKAGKLPVDLSQFPMPAPGVPYSGQAGVYAFANPASPVRQLVGGGALSADSGRFAWLRGKTGGGVSPWDDKSMESIAREEAKHIEGLKGQLEWYEKLNEAVRGVVDGLQEQVNRLRGLRDGLLGARDSLAVSVQQALGFDRGADVLRATQLRDRAQRAFDEWKNLKPGASDEERALALQSRAESVQAMYDMAAGLRGRKGGEQIVSGLIGQAGPLAEGLEEQLTQAARTIDQKLGDASLRLSSAGSRLEEAAASLKAAAYAMLDAKGRAEAELLAVRSGQGAPGAPIVGGGLPGLPNTGKYGTWGGGGAGAQSWSAEEAVAKGYTDPSLYEVFTDCGGGGT